MANLVINRVVGDYNTLNQLKDEGLNMDTPMPGEWDYEWCCTVWGTKWDMYKYRVLQQAPNGKDGILYFITANSAPYLVNIPHKSHIAIDIDEEETHPLIKQNIINELLQEN